MAKKKQDIITHKLTEPKQTKSGGWAFYVIKLINGIEDKKGGKRMVIKKTRAEIKVAHSNKLISLASEDQGNFKTPILKVKEVGDPTREKSIYLKYVDRAREMLMKGIDPAAVIEVIREQRKTEHNIITSTTALDQIIYTATVDIKFDYAKDRQSIVALHLARYNENISALFNAHIDTAVENSKEVERKMNGLYLLMDTMIGKERVLGIHKKSFKLQINNEVEVEKQRKEREQLNIDNLTFQEQLELLELIEIAKLTDFEMVSVKLRQEEVSQKSEAFEEAEVIEETLNIDLIARPKPKAFSKAKQQPKRLTDVTRKLKQSSANEAKKAFKKAKQK